MIQVAVSMIGAEADSAINAAETLKDKLIAAFKVAHNHWMFTDEDLQFRAAIGAVMMRVSDEDKDLLRAELGALRAMSAMVSGIPVDVERMADSIPENPIGLMGLWGDVKAAA